MARLKINEVEGCISLVGDVTYFLSIPYVKLFLNEFETSIRHNEISIAYDSDDSFAEIYNDLVEVIIEEGIEIELGEKIKTAHSDFLDEEERFKEFTNDAELIRNNQLDTLKFTKFIDILSEGMSNRRLYRLQYLSAFHLAFSQNACNFSVPGAGKTSIVYGAYTYLKCLDSSSNKHVDKILVISPISAFGPWIDEYESCFGNEPSYMRISGETSREEKKSYFYSMNPKELTLVSYHSVINLVNELDFYLRNNNVLVVLDEAHKIKNTDGGIIADSILSLSSTPKAKFVLTGTPMPNSYKDLYNIFRFIWPTKDIIKYNQNQLELMTKNHNDERVLELIENVKPFFTRIKKSDLANMPVPIEHSPVIVEMGYYQKLIYSFIASKIKNDLNDFGYSEIKKELIKAKLVRLMQASSNPQLLAKPIKTYGFDGEYEINGYNESNIIKAIENYSNLEIPPKFKATLDLASSIKSRGDKVVIWTTYVENLQSLEKYLMSNDINCISVYGETPIESNDKDILTRESIIKSFKNDKDITVLITNPFAVAESISLHKECHNAIYFERTFNAAHFIQSKDRIHRYGLKETDEINYYYLVTENSIDEKIDEVLKEKEKRMREVIEAEEIPLFKNLNDEAIDDETLLRIMRDYDDM